LVREVIAVYPKHHKKYVNTTAKCRDFECRNRRYM
jgi:hypothetical protein